MSVKKLNESELIDELENTYSTTVPSFIERLTAVLKSEENAIAEYDIILGTIGLPEELRDIIKEIQNDEKDHLVLISNAVQRYTNSEFSDNTEELDELPYPDEDKEIVDIPVEDDEDVVSDSEDSSDELDIDMPDDFDIDEF